MNNLLLSDNLSDSCCPQNKLTRQDRREGGILDLLKLTDLLKIALNLISFIQNV